MNRGFVVSSGFQAFSASAYNTNEAPEEIDFDKSSSNEALLSGLKSNQRFSDASVIVDGKSFPIHKCILAAQSEFFASAFYGGGAEIGKNLSSASGEIVLKNPNLTSENFPELINFLYTKDIKRLKKDVEMAIDFFLLADELLMEELQTVTFKILMAKSPSNFTIKQALLLYKFCHLREQNCLDRDSSKDTQQYSIDTNGDGTKRIKIKQEVDDGNIEQEQNNPIIESKFDYKKFIELKKHVVLSLRSYKIEDFENSSAEIKEFLGTDMEFIFEFVKLALSSDLAKMKSCFPKGSESLFSFGGV